MKGKVRFWFDSEKRQWMILELQGEWPKGWAVPYADMRDAGLVDAFAVAPVESEGLVPGRRYQMRQTLTRQQIVEFIDGLHDLVASVRPTPHASEAAFMIEDERVYE